MQIDLSQLNISFTAIAIISAFLGAVANILARTLLKELRSQDILGINFLTMAATLILLSPTFYLLKPTLLAMGLLVLIGVIDTTANYFFFKTFEKTEASIATPILSLAPAFTFFFGWLVLGDIVSLKTYILAVAIIVLTVLFSVDFKNFYRFKVNTLIPALLASLLFGISAVPSKFLLSQLDAINPPTLYMFRAGFIALFSLIMFGPSIVKISIEQYRIIFFRGLVVISQWVFLYYALQKGSAGVAVTLVNITPIFVFILAIVFLREKPTFKKVLASVLILALSLII